MTDDYFVEMVRRYEAFCLIVRANSPEEAIEKANQEYPVIDTIKVTARSIDSILACPDDVIELSSVCHK